MMSDQIKASNSTLRQTIYYFYWVGFAFIKHVQDADSVNFTEKEN